MAILRLLGLAGSGNGWGIRGIGWKSRGRMRKRFELYTTCRDADDGMMKGEGEIFLLMYLWRYETGFSLYTVASRLQA